MPESRLSQIERAAADFIRCSGLFISSCEHLTELVKNIPPAELRECLAFIAGYDWGATPPPPLPIPTEFARTLKPRFNVN